VSWGRWIWFAEIDCLLHPDATVWISLPSSTPPPIAVHRSTGSAHPHTEAWAAAFELLEAFADLIEDTEV
jgi:hypothetical protein